MDSMLSKSSQMIRSFSMFMTLAKNAPLNPAFLRAQSYSFFARTPKILRFFSIFEENPFALKCHKTDMLLKMNDLTPNHFFANVYRLDCFIFSKTSHIHHINCNPQMTTILTDSLLLMSRL